jgi:hypothetical protein
MDNRTFDITSDGSAALAHAIALAWDNAPGGKATHFFEAKLKSVTKTYGSNTFKELAEDPSGTPTLVLMWSDEKRERCKPLPFPVTQAFAGQYIEQWLANSDYGSEPGHDGDNGKGWRVFTESWGHVLGCQYAILAVQPAWAMYGK